MGGVDDEEDCDDKLFVGEVLTWNNVANACGANEPSYLTRASRLRKIMEPYHHEMNKR